MVPPSSRRAAADEHPSKKAVLARGDGASDDEGYSEPVESWMGHPARASQPTTLPVTSAYEYFAHQHAAAAALAASYGYPYPFTTGPAPGALSMFPMYPPHAPSAGLMPYDYVAAYSAAAAPSPALPVAPLHRPPTTSAVQDAAGDVTTLAQLYSWTVPSSRHTVPKPPSASSGASKLHRPVASLPRSAPTSLRSAPLRGM
mmetsp:Transcript_40651/g.102224  ORF Transcript_40651/g.102224 Transcript_40651/m.102224 type:complete len:201 (+) Transcript_40651:3-605(+)